MLGDSLGQAYFPPLVLWVSPETELRGLVVRVCFLCLVSFGFQASRSVCIWDVRVASWRGCFGQRAMLGPGADGGVDVWSGTQVDLWHSWKSFVLFVSIVFWVLLLKGIIQGQIIDAFAEKRNNDNALREDLETKCFVSSIDRSVDTLPSTTCMRLPELWPASSLKLQHANV